jgi:Ser/Thr protein kinase RdoA (MazF antagonist)
VKLLAAGREAEIYDLGDGRVLRRYLRTGRPEHEAICMEHARAHGYPAPRVYEVRENELVLERVDGHDMSGHMLRRPWRLLETARTLADLHRRLHEVEPPPGLASIADGDTFLHLDLHPLNVIVTARGPIVIDWTNARRGPPALDPALTWVILATSTPARWKLPGRLFTRTFLAEFDRDELVAALPLAAKFRMEDPNLPPVEAEAVRRLVRLATQSAG